MTATGDDQILAELSNAINGAPAVVLATIVATEGSVPRHAGTKMVVRSDGTTLGTVGGGKAEVAIRDDGLATIDRNAADLRTYVLQDPESGDPGVCGGTMTVYLEPYMTPHTVFVVGAGHVGKAVVDLAHWLGYRTVVADDREELVSEKAMPNADIRVAGPVSQALAENPVTENTSIVVVTRSHEIDAEITPLLLSTPAGYLGVMGSKRRWAETARSLNAQGIADETLERIHNPIGLDVGAETVEEIAVSIMSEIIASNAEAQ